MPSLAGKPPYATDEPDSAFEERPVQRRQRKEQALDPNARTSAYDLYDSYLDDTNNNNRNSGIGALGEGLLNGSLDDDDDDDDNRDDEKIRKPVPPAQVTAPRPPAVASHPKPPVVIPLAAPRPGYAAPVAALNLSQPAKVAAPNGRQPPAPMRINVPPANAFIPGYNMSPRSPISVPSTPHPLQPPMTPIIPAFARPPRSPAPSESVTFAATEPIMRGNSEDALIPKRGEKGDDFWRRFSMVAKEENKKPPKMKQSSWLQKTQARSNRLSKLVAIIGFILFLAIAGAIGLRLYLSHNESPNQQPTAVGGSADELNTSASSSPSHTLSFAGSSPTMVTPTKTVARRAVATPDLVPTGHGHRRERALPRRRNH